MPRTPEEYAIYLSKKRDALARFKQTTEVPPSIDLPNPTVVAHRKLVIAAFLNANGDPADGRWMQLAHLCRLATTRGRYRWLGTRVERHTRDGREPSITRVESKYFNNMEKRQNEESCLIQKVESWKQTMTREMVNDAEASNLPKSHARQTPLNFKVAKRPVLMSVPKSSSGRHRSDPQISNASNSDLSFLPPSFPSHLAASTPQPGRRKPPPIPHVSFSSPLILPVNAQVRDVINTPATKAGVRRSFSGYNLVPSTVARLPSSSIGMKAQPYTNNVKSHVLGSFIDKRVSDAQDTVDFLNLLDINGDNFNPPFTSTQKRVGMEGMTPSGTSHDSHFDVDRRVEEVAKLLEEDVGLYR